MPPGTNGHKPAAKKPTSGAKRRFVLFLGASAPLGGLLFGFDVALMSGAGPFLERHFQLDHLALGWALCSLLFGCAVGSNVAGRLTDLAGGKPLRVVGSLDMTVVPAAMAMLAAVDCFRGWGVLVLILQARFPWRFMSETQNRPLEEIERQWR